MRTSNAFVVSTISALGAITSSLRTTAAEGVADNGEIAEIIVTAQKRQQRLQDVPISMTVVNAKELNDLHVDTLADLSRTAPGLEVIQVFGGPGGGGQIRGIGTQSFSATVGSVGIVVDGVSQGDVNINNIFDTAQVEVLEGPQGTLFGLTTSAGVINIITNAPDPSHFESVWHGDYAKKGTAGSEFGQKRLQGAVNVPLTSDSALRIAGTVDDNQGIGHNNFDGRDDTAHNYSFRTRYLLDYSDTFTVNVIADFQRQVISGSEGAGGAAFTYVSADPTLTAQLAACGITPGYGNQDRCADHPRFVADRNYGLSAQLDWHFADSTLTSISAYRRDDNIPNDMDIQALPSANPGLWSTGNKVASHLESEELRLSSKSGARLEYTAGAFYSNYLNLNYYGPGAFFHILVAVPFPPFEFEAGAPQISLTQTTNASEAVFGHLEYHATEELSVFGGLRVTWEQLTNYVSPQGVQKGLGGDPKATNASLNQSNLSGVAGLRYRFSPSWTSYATVAKGYKQPQAQAPSAAGALALIIPAEIPTSYEVGLKGNFFGGKLATDFDAFYTRVHNYQGQTCLLNFQGVLACNPNSLDVTTKGLELNFYGKLISNMTVNGGFIYDQARYPAAYKGLDPNNLNGGTTDMGGLQLVGVPETKFTLSADYTVPLGKINLVLGTDEVYKSEIRKGYSADARYLFPSAWAIGARVGIRSADGVWGVTAWGRDINNAHEPAILFGGPAFYGPAPPTGIPFFFNPAYPNGAVAGISGWILPQSLREVGLSFDLKF